MSTTLHSVAPSSQDMLRDVVTGLSKSQKQLDPKYFYDERGSALFEQITMLPEYYPTRAERALLEACMPALIAEIKPRSLVELGAGSAIKTRVILDAMRDAGCGRQYVPVDVSAEFLAETAVKVSREYPSMSIDSAVGDFSSELSLPAIHRPALFAFLGSTIGNFSERAAVGILGRIVQQMQSGDYFILGIDLRKDPVVIAAAYNDSAGITAEFNLNVLRVLNRDLGANFDLRAFRHRAFYDGGRHRIEMHLDALADQRISIPRVPDIDIRRGESIRTELSYKYDRPTVESLFEKAALRLDSWLTDSGRTFALAVGRRLRTSS